MVSGVKSEERKMKSEREKDNNTVPGPIREAIRLGIERNPMPSVRNPSSGKSNIRIKTIFNTLQF